MNRRIAHQQKNAHRRRINAVRRTWGWFLPRDVDLSCVEARILRWWLDPAAKPSTGATTGRVPVRPQRFIG